MFFILELPYKLLLFYYLFIYLENLSVTKRTYIDFQNRRGIYKEYAECI